MKIKLDENLPEELVEILSARSHDVHTIRQQRLIGKDDSTIFSVCKREQRMLITQDLDFSDLRHFKPGTHPGIILIRLRDPSRRRLIARIQKVLETESLDSWAKSFIVITDAKLRVRGAAKPS